jgi:hypothetical protein
MPNPAATQNFILFRICKPHTRLTGKVMIARSIRMANTSTTIQRCIYNFVLAADWYIGFSKVPLTVLRSSVEGFNHGSVVL